MDTPDLDLNEDRYWLVWALGGSLSAGPFVPPVALGGDSNGEQALGQNAFARVNDTGTGLTAELPFQLNGPAATVPEPTSLALVLAAGLAAMGAAKRRAA